MWLKALEGAKDWALAKQTRRSLELMPSIPLTRCFMCVLSTRHCINSLDPWGPCERGMTFLPSLQMRREGTGSVCQPGQEAALSVLLSCRPAVLLCSSRPLPLVDHSLTSAWVPLYICLSAYAEVVGPVAVSYCVLALATIWIICNFFSLNAWYAKWPIYDSQF